MTADPLIGQKIGNYVISEHLQEGGMGMVYVAEHPEIGRRIAVKVVSEGLSGQPGIADRFLAEARAISRIDHPNIIDIYDFGRTPTGQLYYTMELLMGHELAALMHAQGPMAASQALPYVQQVCSALQAAHERGVIHRDLKPENIFILDREPMALKLLDFGIAKVVDTDRRKMPSLTATGMVIGTPYTIAPEQAAGRSDQISPRTDIYSLGVIVYWMLAGAPPFMAEASALILAQHIKEPPPPLGGAAPHVSPAVASVVEQCLAKTPKKRPDSAEELARRFTEAVESDEAEDPGTADTLEVTGRGRVARRPSGAWGAPTAAASAGGRARSAVRGTRSGQNRPSQLSGKAALASVSAQAGRSARSGQPRATTLNGVARVWAVTTRMRSWRGWVWVLGIGVLLGLVASLWWAAALPEESPAEGGELASPSGREAEEQASVTSAATPEHKPPPAPPATDDVSHIKAVTITADDLRARCEVQIGEGPTHRQPLPCNLQVTAGQQVRLQVVRRGYTPFVREWVVEKDERVELRTLYVERAFVRVGQSPGRASTDAGAAGDERKTTAPKRAAAGRPRPRRPPAPARPKSPEAASSNGKKAAAEELGEGTMSF